MNAVHGEENDGRRKQIATFDHGGQIVNRRELNTADTQALRGKRQNHSPEFVSRIA